MFLHFTFNILILKKTLFLLRSVHRSFSVGGSFNVGGSKDGSFIAHVSILGLSVSAFLLLPVLFCVAQVQTNQWRFGHNAAIDFNSGVPVSISGSVLTTDEGSASIADSSGNLLFYTDGVTVWDKNENVMNNGTGLEGGPSSTQSALIVPMPLGDSLYYIFTTGQQLAYGLSYSIVDMSLQGGLGQVIAKNVQLDDQTCEKVTAICHSNGQDKWILAHDWGNNVFQAYQLTDTGIVTVPVTTAIGQTMTGASENTIGYLKGSPDGSKLALAQWYNNYFEMFDFDIATGIVSHHIFLSSYNQASSGAYGVEFSPDGTRLYGSVITPGYIYQWDLTAGSDSLIQLSRTLVGTSAVNFNGALQLATDGKIYMAEYGSSWLGVINDPNVLGTGCNYDDTGFQLSSGSNGIGLPNMYYCSSPSVFPPFANFIVSDTTICEKFCIDFFDSSSNNPVSWLWIFPGGSPAGSSDQNPSNVCYQNPGVFDVTLIATNANGNSDTLTLPDYITVYTNPFAPVITQAGNVLSSSPATSYQWQLNLVDIPGATNQSYTILQSGLYTVLIGDENGCKAQASIDAFLVGIPEVDENSFVNIFPNPSSGSFMVEFSYANLVSNETENWWLEIKVVNTLGQIVFSSIDKTYSPSFKKEIDIINAAHGVYFVVIKTENDIIRKKIVIAH